MSSESIDFVSVTTESEECFCIHFDVSGTFNLKLFLEQLQARYELTILTGGGGRFMTIKINIRPSHLRILLKILPYTVIVSYETEKPEKR